ncbi:MAG: hypothetical protein ABIG34_02025 [Candidatus Peregrinibacteria bacterium]
MSTTNTTSTARDSLLLMIYPPVEQDESILTASVIAELEFGKRHCRVRLGQCLADLTDEECVHILEEQHDAVARLVTECADLEQGGCYPTEEFIADRLRVLIQW